MGQRVTPHRGNSSFHHMQAQGQRRKAGFTLFSNRGLGRRNPQLHLFLVSFIHCQGQLLVWKTQTNQSRSIDMELAAKVSAVAARAAVTQVTDLLFQLNGRKKRLQTQKNKSIYRNLFRKLNCVLQHSSNGERRVFS